MSSLLIMQFITLVIINSNLSTMLSITNRSLSTMLSITKRSLSTMLSITKRSLSTWSTQFTQSSQCRVTSEWKLEVMEATTVSTPPLPVTQ